MKDNYGIFTVCFIGNVKRENAFDVSKKVERIAGSLIRSRKYVNFLVCKNNDSCRLFCFAIFRAMLNFDRGNFSIVVIGKDSEKKEEEFLLPEVCSTFLKFEECSKDFCYRYMIDKSDLCAFCIDENDGKINRAFEYALKREKTVTNLMNEKFY